MSTKDLAYIHITGANTYDYFQGQYSLDELLDLAAAIAAREDQLRQSILYYLITGTFMVQPN